MTKFIINPVNGSVWQRLEISQQVAENSPIFKMKLNSIADDFDLFSVNSIARSVILLIKWVGMIPKKVLYF